MAKFRTRARTVDMLGRQQIAGIPTAISELFKNGHDAYASEVTAHFIQPERLFVLRDDGVGMTREEFEQGWLTLGTESKFGGTQPSRTGGLKPRAVLGEKGIGRLAISVIGPQVLVMTRARPEMGAEHPLVVSFIHWGVFEIPGVNLEELDVPLMVWSENTLPSASEVQDLIEEVRTTLDRLGPAVPSALNVRIRQELATFDVDPSQTDLALLGPPLSEGGCGTHFYIKPTDESLAEQLADPESDQGSRLQRMLIGFANTMTPDHPEPPVKARFWHQRTSDDVVDLIEETEFFTPHDFASSDHTISGTFDEFGQFEGRVSVFGGESTSHSVVWARARGRTTQCGPFQINVAYVQGQLGASRLPPDEYVRMDRKLNRVSGLYVYRDGIRVLPYGNHDYDWLNIEERRTRSASYYYFSYRRMFGAIEVSSRQNQELQEKAGREGFRENIAYRQFRDILENFFQQIAADFFREGGTYATPFVLRREELKAEEKARQKRERRVSARRKDFRNRLNKTLLRIDEGAPTREAEEAKATFLKGLALAREETSDVRATELLLDAEVAARAQLADIRESYRVAKPRGVGFGRELRRDWDAYLAEYAVLQEKVFPQLELELDSIITSNAVEAGHLADTRRRVEHSLGQAVASARSETNRRVRESRKLIQATHDGVTGVLQDVLTSLETILNKVEGELASTDVAKMTEEEVIAFRANLEEQIDGTVRRGKETLDRIEDRLHLVQLSTGGSDETVDVEAAMDEELLALRERSELDLELASLGMAVEVINHEFDSSLRAIRTYLRRLKSWSDKNPPLQRLHEGLAGSFDHLDGYLTLFTPLQRRSQRRDIEIKGVDIYLFLKELFRNRLQQDAVTLKVSDGFRDTVIVGQPSSFYPVFVNLIDNALFWLADAPEPRLITLETDGADVLVRDTGPGIRARDSEVVFELGFTRKPGGRGLGLHLSREILAKAGWDLFVDSENVNGAVFRMRKRQSLDGGK